MDYQLFDLTWFRNIFCGKQESTGPLRCRHCWSVIYHEVYMAHDQAFCSDRHRVKHIKWQSAQHEPLGTEFE
jgi:hypothetical protein